MAKKIYVGVQNFTPVQLPSGYTQVEYIRSSGTQYIDTGIQPNQNISFELQAWMSSSGANYATLFGARDSNQCRVYYSGSLRAIYLGSNTASISSSINPEQILSYSLNNQTFAVGDVSVSLTPNVNQIEYSIFIFGLNDNGSFGYGSIAEIYSFKIKQQNSVVRDYVPCINSVGEVGLYDLVSNTFFGNEGTGTFTAGPVLTSVAQQVKKMYVGVNGISHKVQKAYVGVNGIAQQFWPSVLPPEVLNLWDGTTSDNYISSVIYANGYWVVGGTYQESNGSYPIARIAYATNLNGPWTVKDIQTGKTQDASRIFTQMIYANGYWAICGKYTDNNNTERTYIAYATAPNANWTTRNLWSDDYGYVSTSGLIYANEQWVVYGQTSDNRGRYVAIIAYANNITGSWTTQELWTNHSTVRSADFNSLIYSNGYWVAGGGYFPTGAADYSAIITYCTNLGGTWTQKTLWENSSGLTQISKIAYENGYWVACGTNGDKDIDRYRACVAYTTNLSGSWTTENLWSSRSGNASCDFILYANGYWIVCGELDSNNLVTTHIAYTTNPTGAWTQETLWNGYEGSVSSFYFENNFFVAIGSYHPNNGNTSYPSVTYTQNLGSSWEINSFPTSLSGFNLLSIIYSNGYWITGGRQLSSGNYYAKISYADTLANLGS